jgi:hypothetical protein
VLIGATMTTADLPTLAAGLAGNNIMRIFPADVTAAGKATKALPPWTDPRFAYCRQAGAIPFVSTKADGDPAAIAYIRTQLLTMPAWVGTLYITDRHEPEGDLTPTAFKANFTLFMAMIEALPQSLRARVRCGPVLTKTWAEQTGAGRSYDTYDPGIGDFFGGDMYVQSGTAKTVVTPATLPTPQQFTAAFKAYKKNSGDRRARIWPEWGVIGMPDDVDGTARAAWIRAVHAEVKTWTPATTGWPFLGMIWWNSPGKATGQVAVIGQRRDFPLSMRTQPAPAGLAVAAAGAIGVQLPGNPPAPVAAYNELFTAENRYADGWKDGRAQLLEEIAELVAGTVFL